MVFNSLIFLLFLAVVLLVYYRLRHRGQNWFLLIASWFFYGWWDWRFLGLLWFTSLFDYFCARWIEGTDDPRRRKLLLAGSMIPGQPFPLVMTWLCATGFAAYFWPSPFWALPTLTLTASAAAVAIGFIPRAMRTATEPGVDWSKLTGSGRNGRIRERDGLAAARGRR